MNDDHAVLLRIEDLLRVVVRVLLAGKLSTALTDEKLRLLYANTGELTRPELVKITGFSGGKISGLWQQWEQQGLLLKDGKSYRKPY